jgi:tetratricopeptide (TPR) repeat protein
MNNRIVIRALSALVAVSMAFAAVQGQPAAPPAKQPSVKSPAEGQALQAIFRAVDAETRIKAATDFVVKFADSDFKALALLAVADAYQGKNDYANMVIFAERALEADPAYYMAMLMLARGIAQHTREHDLDREEKLGRVEQYANGAIELVKAGSKPNPQMSDEQWTQAKAIFNSQAHEALGIAAAVRKNYDLAITEYKAAVELAKPPDPATQVRLGAAYNQAKRYDEAIAILDQVMAAPDVHPQVRQIAQAERVRAIQAKGGPAKPAAPATPPAPAATPAPATPPAPAAAPAHATPPAHAAAPAPAEPKKP